MPIKIEKAQFDRKITRISEKELLDVYSDIYEIINFDALKNFQKKQGKNKKYDMNYVPWAKETWFLFCLKPSFIYK